MLRRVALLPVAGSLEEADERLAGRALEAIDHGRARARRLARPRARGPPGGPRGVPARAASRRRAFVEELQHARGRLQLLRPAGGAEGGARRGDERGVVLFSRQHDFLGCGCGSTRGACWRSTRAATRRRSGPSSPRPRGSRARARAASWPGCRRPTVSAGRPRRRPRSSSRPRSTPAHRRAGRHARPALRQADRVRYAAFLRASIWARTGASAAPSCARSSRSSAWTTWPASGRAGTLSSRRRAT